MRRLLSYGDINTLEYMQINTQRRARAYSRTRTHAHTNAQTDEHIEHIRILVYTKIMDATVTRQKDKCR